MRQLQLDRTDLPPVPTGVDVAQASLTSSARALYMSTRQDVILWCVNAFRVLIVECH